MVCQLVEAYSGDIDEMIKEAVQAKSGCKDLCLGCKATVLDAARLVEKCWKALAPLSVANCWKHANILQVECHKDSSPLEGSSIEEHHQLIEDFQTIYLEIFTSISIKRY